MTRESQRLLFLPLATCTCSMSSWSKLLTVKQVKLICMLNFKISPVFFPSALFYVGEIHNMPLPNAQNGTSELEPVVVMMWLAPARTAKQKKKKSDDDKTTRSKSGVAEIRRGFSKWRVHRTWNFRQRGY